MNVTPTIQNLHGRLRSITGTNPDPGVEISETVPTRRRWRPQSIRIRLTTDATVANRNILLIIDDGTTPLTAITTTTPQTASKSINYYFSNIGAPEINTSPNHSLPFPPLTLPSGYRIITATENLQAGDDFSAPQLLVEEWIDP